MKILFAIQGTGNGHLSRAQTIIPVLKKYCEVDILVSGYQNDIVLDEKITYRLRGLSFIFGNKGGVDLWNTYVKANLKKLQTEINSLPVEKYDFILNDFEPVSAWACYKKKIPCVSLSHQSAVLNPNAPKPKKRDLLGKFILKNYAPSNIQFGLHFSPYDTNITTPIIRNSIREAQVEDLGHYTVYLPAYSDKKIIKVLSQIEDARWMVFSKHSTKSYSEGNIDIIPINNAFFIESFRTCSGLLCGAGFEAPAEALFMGKKLLVKPMSGQYEQQCNAAALKKLGIPVLKKFKSSKVDKIREWVESEERQQIDYPDYTKQIVQLIFEKHIQNLISKNNWKSDFSLIYKAGKTKDEVLIK